MRQEAAAHYNHTEAVITLMSGVWCYNVRNNVRCNLNFTPFNKIETLRNLAHELSHLKLFWDGESDKHTPLRQIVESIFTIHLMELLEEDEYIDEETESKQLKKSVKI